MAQKFVGIVLVRCNCDHAIAGAPIEVRVQGASGLECNSSGLTNAFGFFIFHYQRGGRPVDVQSMDGTVQACGQEVTFQTHTIKLGVDWEAVVQRILDARGLSRRLTVEDLKAQVEFFSFTSLDLVMFSAITEVTVKCHDSCRDTDADDHGADSVVAELVTVAETRFLLNCPTEVPEVLSGTLYGMGFGATPADARQNALDRVLELAQQKVKERVNQYGCRDGCRLVTTPTYDDHRASRAFPYGSSVSSVKYQSLGVVHWTVSLRCE